MSPAAAQANDWTDADESRLVELSRAQYDVEPLHDFIGRINPRYPPPKHLDPLIEVLERARHETVYAIVCLPPRHRKTTTVCNGLAWLLANDPMMQHAYCAYNQKRAEKMSKLVRRLAKKAGCTMNKERQGIADWGVMASETVHGGGLLAAGVDGGLTGEGITGLAVLDDPIKNRKDANSEAKREDAWDFTAEVVLTRCEPGSSIIIVLTRWHPDDVAGRLLGGKLDDAFLELGIDPIKFEEIVVPALCEDVNDGTGRQVGEALWPEVYGRNFLLGRQAILGDHAFAALYQQRPYAKGAKLFRQPATFNLTRFLGVEAANFNRQTFLRPRFDDFVSGLEGCRLVIGVDPAASEATRADYSAGVVLAVKGYGSSMRGWVLDVWHEQINPIDAASALQALQAKWLDAILAVEGGPIGKAVIPMLIRLDKRIQVVECKTTLDKFSRAQPVAAAWNSGRLLVPTAESWAHDFVDELKKFTGAKGGKDDRVDALAHAWNLLADVEDLEGQYEEVDGIWLPMG